MGFQEIKRVEDYKFYCDLALRRANAVAEDYRKKTKGDRFTKSKKIELQKMVVIRNTLYEKMSDIMKSFPDFDRMTEFYQELVKVVLDYPMLMQSLGAVNGARYKLGDLFSDYNNKYKKVTEPERLNVVRREFVGRAFSVIKSVRKSLEFLEESRRLLVEFPSIKHEMKKVAIAGFPNVGKSTLMSKISKAKPEIAAYAFTTKRLNLGNYENDDKKMQLIDTPGTLNRPEKMNFVEKMAYVAMKHAADLIIYVFDLTEEYPIDDQIKLYEQIRGYKKPIIIYLSKTDILENDVVESFKKKHKNAISDIEQLKRELENAI